METVYKIQIAALVFYVTIATDLKWLACIIFAILALKYLFLKKEIDDFIDTTFSGTIGEDVPDSNGMYQN